MVSVRRYGCIVFFILFQLFVWYNRLSTASTRDDNDTITNMLVQLWLNELSAMG